MKMFATCPYIVGTILQLASDTDPNVLYSGTTWERIEGKFLVAAGEAFPFGTSGGANEHVLSVSEMPAHIHNANGHTHSVTPHSHGLNNHVHSIGAHSHGLNGHTHSYAQRNTPCGGTAVSVAQLAAHSHSRVGWWTVDIANYSPSENKQCLSRYLMTGDSNSGLENTGSGNAHNHSIGVTSTATGAASGSTANSAAFNTGAATGNTANSAAFESGATEGDTDVAGGGQPFSLLPPYKVVNTWKRVA